MLIRRKKEFVSKRTKGQKMGATFLAIHRMHRYDNSPNTRQQFTGSVLKW